MSISAAAISAAILALESTLGLFPTCYHTTVCALFQCICCLQVVTEVRSLPRFIGEWGDIAITLKDKTIVELKAVPKFREIAKYIEARAQASRTEPLEGSSTSASPSKGF